MISSTATRVTPQTPEHVNEEWSRQIEEELASYCCRRPR